MKASSNVEETNAEAEIVAACGEVAAWRTNMSSEYQTSLILLTKTPAYEL